MHKGKVGGGNKSALGFESVGHNEMELVVAIGDLVVRRLNGWSITVGERRHERVQTIGVDTLANLL